jgi:HAD superfamily hydrolase (TIGR01450 family)
VASAMCRGSATLIDLEKGPERLYSGYIFDLDGTVYLGDRLLPGASRTILKLRELGKRVVFATNNPSGDVQMYVDKLAGMGVSVSASDVVTSVSTTTEWLIENEPQAVVFPIGEEALRESLRENGIRTSDEPAEIDIVIASTDRQFDYRKLTIAFRALRRRNGARLICTNTDRVTISGDGTCLPAAGAIVAAIEASAGVKCEVDCGKPGLIMLAAVMRSVGHEPKDCICVGDRLYTDIKMGIDAGMDTGLVFTGEATPESLIASPPDQHPTYAFDRIDRLVPVALWEEFGWTELNG